MSKTNNNKKKKNQKEIISKFDFINDSFSIPQEKYVYNENNNSLNQKGTNTNHSYIQSSLTPSPTFSTSTSNNNILSKSFSPPSELKKEKRRRSCFDQSKNKKDEKKKNKKRVTFQKNFIEYINVESYKEYNNNEIVPEKRKEKSCCKCEIF
jgi:hypothetical protein